MFLKLNISTVDDIRGNFSNNLLNISTAADCDIYLHRVVSKLDDFQKELLC